MAVMAVMAEEMYCRCYRMMKSVSVFLSILGLGDK